MKKFVLFISFGNQLREVNLPGVDNRKGVLNLERMTGIKELQIAYEVWDGIWHLLTSEKVRISMDHMIQQDVVLKDGMILNGKINETDMRFQIMVKLLDKEEAQYEKYDIRYVTQIRIGRNNGCDVVLKDNYISDEHAVFYRQGGNWYIQNQSTNGTYVNGEIINAPTRLRTLDKIYVPGFQFIYMGTFLAINHKEQHFARLERMDRKQIENQKEHSDFSSFSRNPRQVEPLDQESVELDAPPSPAKRGKTPMLFVLGPSLTMPIPILTMVIFNIVVNKGSGNSPLSYFGMVISVMMFALLGVFWTVMRNRYDKQNMEQNERQRQGSYQNYILQNEQLLMEKQRQNREILEQTYKKSEFLATELMTNRFQLWNRNVNHEDFLHIRMGEGCMVSPNEIHIPKQRFSVDADPLATLPGEIYKKYKYLAPAVKTLNLKENKLIGVVGVRKDIQKIANSMIIQIAALHSYSDVRMAFLTSDDEKLNLQWCKWLPHTFSEDRKVRLLANEEQSAQSVLYTLTGILRGRKENPEEVKNKIPCHYIVFTTEKEIYENETIYKYMTDEEDYGFTFVMLHGRFDALPNECKCIVEVSRSFQGIYRLDETRTFVNQVQFDHMSTEQAEKFARSISGVYIHELAEGSIPESIDYLTMIGIRNVNHWDLIKHYKENRSFEGIKSMIGIASNGKPMILDIHEKKYGPHGLVAGTTGSGKSETIQTFILSLALNYHPDEVAFILIDYKGGGMANAFLGLPHLAGTITNLEDEGGEGSIDGNQTRRALISIRSEIKRRQTIFNQYKVNHIDMYMRLYRENKAKKPMPHLIIISDEFAELKKEQPEFIRELVSTARVGRSLGIHLILATQKPAGVVDDEIWSNSRFKLCLRVQDKQDSLGMLKRPEAAFLTTTGRAYLQIGNDEMFEMFQSGYSGARYEPEEAQSEASGAEVEMIGLDGSEAVLRPKKTNSEENAKSQLEVCVEYIIRKAEENHIRAAMPLWLPRLEKEIFLARLEQDYPIDYTQGIRALAGLIDYPEQQRQDPLVIEMEETANLLIVGNAGCGKTMLIKTILLSLVRHYAPEDVQFYCMDFSSRTMKVFQQLPHCGGVAFSEEEEKVTRLLKLLQEMIEERKHILEKAGAGSYQEYRRMNEKLPLVISFIDNYYEFVSQYNSLEDAFTRLVRDGVRYGIIFVVSLNSTGDMRYRIRQNFEEILPIQMQERGDYMDAFGKSPEILPGKLPGRGLVLREKVLEYQAALPAEGETEEDRQQMLRDMISESIRKYQNSQKAREIPVLPENETYAEFWNRFGIQIKEGFLPLAYNRQTLKPEGINLKEDHCICISATKMKSIELVFKNVIYAGKKAGYRVDYIQEGSQSDDDLTHLADASYRGFEEVKELLISIKKGFKGTKQEWTGYEGKRIILIRDMKAFFELVYNGKNPEAMDKLVEVFFGEGARRGVYFIGGFVSDVQSTYLYLPAGKIFTGYKKIWHLGGALNQQKLVQFAIPTTQQMKPLPVNEGHAVEEGETIEIYVPEPEGNLDEYSDSGH